MNQPEPTRSFALETRYAGRRLMRRGKFLLGHDPLFLPILLRLTPEGNSRQITDHTELVVEGFPRSGNTFVVFALQDAAHHRLNLSSHVHHPSQVKLAVSRALPTVLVVREPVGTLASYLSFGQHGRPAMVLKEYSGYLRELVPYVDQVVICDFTEVVSDLSAVIDRINDRFSTSIPHFDQTPENTDKVFDEIERHHQLLHGRLDPVNVAPRPSAGRRDVSDRARAGILDPQNETLLAEAVKLYDYFAGKAAQQRDVLEALHANPPAPSNGRTSGRRATAGGRGPKRNAPTASRSGPEKPEG
jgi:hypothetical protein